MADEGEGLSAEVVDQVTAEVDADGGGSANEVPGGGVNLGGGEAVDVVGRERRSRLLVFDFLQLSSLFSPLFVLNFRKTQKLSLKSQEISL